MRRGRSFTSTSPLSRCRSQNLKFGSKTTHEVSRAGAEKNCTPSVKYYYEDTGSGEVARKGFEKEGRENEASPHFSREGVMLDGIGR
jgi:hypothetical protein